MIDISEGDEKLIIEQNPLALVKHGYLTIKTKADALRKLELNPVQRIILGIIEKQARSGKPVRALILKARQMGVTTLIEALFYALTSQREGVNSLVIADDVKGSNYIFEMQKTFHEFLDGYLKPVIEHSNEKKLSFEGIKSQVLIDTAENKNAGRKYTIRYCHLSEAAFFPDLEAVMLGLSQAVSNRPGTMIIMETTANGVSNAFYDRWCKAVEGNSDWVPVFIPWFEMLEYRMPLMNGEFYSIEDVSGRTKFLEEENNLKKRHGLSDEQLNWRRWCIVNNCNGDVDKFSHEYPSSWEEAFLASGSLYFDRDRLAVEAVKAADKGGARIGEIVKMDGKYVFRLCEDGRFRVYEMPGDAEVSQYCIGADAAEGLPHGDDAAAVVLNKKTNVVVCAYNVCCDTEEFSEDLYKMGSFYNMAMIAPENKGYGSSVCRNLYKVYGNIFRKIIDKTGVRNVTDELGWNTNSVTRGQMLMQLKEEFKEGAVIVRDKEILAQMRTFINHPKKKRPEADKGKKDDLVFALAIAVMVRTYYPYVARSVIEKARKNRMLARPLTVNQGYGFKKT